MSDVMQAEAAPAEIAPETAPTESPDPIEATMTKVHDQHRPPRGTNAQFSRKPPGDAELAGYKDRGVEHTSSSETEPTERPAEPDQIKRPASWGAKTAASWETLPREVQEEIAKREQDIQRVMSERGRTGLPDEVTQKLDEVVGRYAQTLPKLPDGRPMPTAQLLETMLAANQVLERSPREALQWLARSYGVDLGGMSPDAESIRQQTRAEMQQEFQQYQQQQYAAQQQQTGNYVQQFAADKPYWPEIENSVLYHIMALKGTDPQMDYREVLKTAHDRALAEKPEADKTKSQQRRAEAKKKADEAKRLASLNVRSSTGTSPRSTSKDFYADMADVYDRITATGR